MKTLNTYMHNIGVIWLTAPSTIMDSRKLLPCGLRATVCSRPSILKMLTSVGQFLLFFPQYQVGRIFNVI
jgi:hypothetical protein